nr:hypothetical protein [Sicyoidochytrium minutum DNA virus]
MVTLGTTMVTGGSCVWDKFSEGCAKGKDVFTRNQSS